MRHRALPCLLLLPLTAQLACGDKPDNTGGPPGGGGDGGAEDCTLELAPAGKVETDPTCEAVVDRLLGISVDWQWTGAEGYESFNTVITTPVVGDVDGDGHPEIVVTVTDPAYHFSGGVLAVIDGVTGQTDLLLGDVDGATISDTGGVALADLDGDGTPEILVLTMDSTIAAVHADGEVLWESASQSSVMAVYTHLGAADFDGDGL
ncbi:MAG: VCBS repeat-containing protein, partial [Deltaproteobacteria bacterium]